MAFSAAPTSDCYTNENSGSLQVLSADCGTELQESQALLNDGLFNQTDQSLADEPEAFELIARASPVNRGELQRYQLLPIPTPSDSAVQGAASQAQSLTGDSLLSESWCGPVSGPHQQSQLLLENSKPPEILCGPAPRSQSQLPEVNQTSESLGRPVSRSQLQPQLLLEIGQSQEPQCGLIYRSQPTAVLQQSRLIQACNSCYRQVIQCLDSCSTRTRNIRSLRQSQGEQEGPSRLPQSAPHQISCPDCQRTAPRDTDRLHCNK